MSRRCDLIAITGRCDLIVTPRSKNISSVADGLAVGVGEADGLADADLDGLLDGLLDGEADGLSEPDVDGLSDGLFEADVDGLLEGLPDRDADGLRTKSSFMNSLWTCQSSNRRLPVILIPARRKKAKEMTNVKLDRAYVGSCTGGKTSDFVEFARVLRGRKVAIDTFGVPETPDIVHDLQSTRWGNQTIWQILVDAGVQMTENAGCAACLGGPVDTFGRINKSGTKCISATNRNFPGRMGDKESQVFLASPASGECDHWQGDGSEGIFELSYESASCSGGSDRSLPGDGAEQRVLTVLRLHELACEMARLGIRRQHPNANPREVERLLHQRLELARAA